jgi:hypothetical protein
MLKAIPKIVLEKNQLPSVNLSLDGKDPLDFLNHFYLSKKGSMVVADILEGVISDKRKRVGTLTAPPGSGKSYLALFIGSLLASSPDWDESLNSLLLRQNKTHSGRISEALKTQSDKLTEMGFNVKQGEDLNKNSRVVQHFTQIIKDSVSTNNGFKSFEKVTDFRFLPKAMEVGDEVTNLFKMKRNVIFDKYAALIKEMYT